jgi:hypothetical protein
LSRNTPPHNHPLQRSRQNIVNEGGRLAIGTISANHFAVITRSDTVTLDIDEGRATCLEVITENSGNCKIPLPPECLVNSQTRGKRPSIGSWRKHLLPNIKTPFSPSYSRPFSLHFFCLHSFLFSYYLGRVIFYFSSLSVEFQRQCRKQTNGEHRLVRSSLLYIQLTALIQRVKQNGAEGLQPVLSHRQLCSNRRYLRSRLPKKRQLCSNRRYPGSLLSRKRLSFEWCVA